MEPLNLPLVQFKIKREGTKQFLFDAIRRKWVVLTPEEWVRQHFIRFLIDCHGYPTALIGVEVPVSVNSLKQRADVIVYNRYGHAVMIVECKASSVKLTNQVFDQVARYNLSFKVPYLIVTNGLQHIGAKLNHTEGSYEWLAQIPNFESIGGEPL